MGHLQSVQDKREAPLFEPALAGTANLTLTSTEANEMPLSLLGFIEQTSQKQSKGLKGLTTSYLRGAVGNMVLKYPMLAGIH